MTTKNEIAQILRDASSYIEKYGWVQGVSQDQFTGAVCASGAISNCAFLMAYNLSSKAHEVLAQFLSEQYGDWDDLGIAGWNDTKGRTKEEVIDNMLCCAEKLEASEVI